MRKLLISALLALCLPHSALAEEEWKGMKLAAWECEWHFVEWHKLATDVHELIITWSPKEVGRPQNIRRIGKDGS
jgi:hypothetical protein